MKNYKVEYKTTGYRGLRECYFKAKDKEHAVKIFNDNYVDCKIVKVSENN